MGLFDIVGDIAGRIGRGAQTVGREVGETFGGFAESVVPAIFGSPVDPQFRDDRTRALGQVIGGAVGGAVRTQFDDFLTGEAERRAGPGGLVAGRQQGPGGAVLRQPATGRPQVVPGSFTGEPQELPIETQIFAQPTAGFMPMAQPSALPGGAQISRAGIGEGLFPLIPQIGQFLFGNGGQEMAQMPALPGAQPGTLFRVSGPRLRPNPLVMVRNPTTGTVHFWKLAGRPILFSGDLAVAKRVDKLARRARSARRGR